MKHLWLLTKISFGSTFDFNKFFKKSNLKQKILKTLAIIGAFILLVLILITAFFYSYSIGIVLGELGQVELLPGLMMALVCVIVIILTMSRVKGTLFGFKDYDLLISLPIKTSIILASRLITLYIINLAFTLIVMIPTNIAYAFLAKPSVSFHIYSFILLFIIPVIPMIIGTIFGTIIIYISARMKYTNLINIALNILLVVGILAFSFFTASSEEAVYESTNYIANQINELYPFASMYKEAVINNNIVSLVMFVGISLILYMVYVGVIARKFVEINTSITSTYTNTKKKRRRYKASSPFVALYKKELLRFFSSSIYVLNTGIGMILLLLISIVTLFINDETIVTLLETPAIAETISGYVPLVLPFFIILSYTAACSISLEGDNLWIIKSIPVTTKSIFHSKIAVNLTVILPLTYISIIILSVGLNLNIIDILISLAMTSVYAFFTSIAGLLTNLLFPSFNWKSEVFVIKQSLSSLIAIFGGIIIAILPIIPHVMLLESLSPQIINLITIIIISLLSLLLYTILIKKGTKRFHAL